MKERCTSVAVIGAGNITSLRHIPALRASGRATITGVVDPIEERAKAVARRFGLVHWATDLSAGWLDGSEAVTIGVPPAAHAETAQRALEMGKHVLLEKPMTLRLEDARALARLAEDTSRILAVVHNFQFSRSAMRLKSLIAGGRLGEITGIFGFQTSTKQRRLPIWHEDLPLGLFYDEAPHLLYLTRAFGGELRVCAVTVNRSSHGKETPALITVHLRAGDTDAVLYSNFEAPVSEWLFSVYGSEAMGIIDIFRDILIVLPNDGPHLAKEVMRTSLTAMFHHTTGLLRSGLAMVRGRLLYGNEEVVRRFLDAVASGEDPEGISAEDGVSIVQTQHEIITKAEFLSPGPAEPG